MRILTAADAGTIAQARTGREYFWLDLVDPDPNELEALGQLLEWHPLLVEDLRHRSQRPKVEDFADHVLIVAYAVAPAAASRDDLQALDHMLVVHGDYLVTVRSARSHGITDLRATAERDANGMTEGGLVHRVLDIIVDTTTAAANDVSAEIEVLEQAIDDGETDRVLERLRATRRYVTELFGLVVAQRDALTTVSPMLEAIPGFEMGLRTHFRDVTDHARRSVDRLGISSRLLDGAFEAYYTTLVSRQNSVMQRLTVVSTVFLPLTFVTGFFGQNFGWMVEQVDSRSDFLLYGVGTTVLTGLLLGALFRRLRWW